MLGKPNTPSNDASGRSQSEILGVVLLLGMVIVVGMALLVFGVALMDDLESSSVRENVHSSLDATVHTLSSVTAGDDVEELPLDLENGDMTIHETGSLQTAWYGDHDKSGGTPPSMSALDGNTCHWEEDPLGAIEYTYEDRMAVIQGGGIWENRGDEWATYSAPNVVFSGSNASTMQIRLNVMTIDEDDVDDRDTLSVYGNSSNQEALPDPSTCESYRPHFRMELTTEYPDAWYKYLDEQTDIGQAGNTTLDRSGDTITVDIQGFATNDYDSLRVEEDLGVDPDHKVANDEPLVVHARVTNPTDTMFTECNVALDVIGTPIETDGSGYDGIDTGSCGGSNIPPGTTENVTFRVPSSNHSSHLEVGTVYDYTIHPVDDSGSAIPDNGLDSPGSFYYGMPGAHLNVSEPRVDGQDASTTVNATNQFVNITANVTNLGVQDASDAPLTLALDPTEAPETPDDPYYDDDERLIDREYGQSGDVTWILNTSYLLTGKHDFTISSDHDSTSGSFEIQQGINPEDSHIFVDPNNQVNVTVAGTESGYTNPDRDGTERIGPTDVNDGAFVRNGDGPKFSFEFEASDPDNEDDEMPVSSDGGWVATDGSEPEPEGYWHEECHGWPWDRTCEDVWEGTGWSWDADELVWSDSGGYDISWSTDSDGDFVWRGSQWSRSGDLISVDEYDPNFGIRNGLDIYTEPVDENGNPTGEPVLRKPSWHNQNLNVDKGEVRPLFTHNFVTTERVAFQLAAHKESNQYCSKERMYDIGENNGELVVWDNHYCSDQGPDKDDQSTFSLEVGVDTREPNVQVLTDGDLVPEINSGSSTQYQRNIDQLLEREGVGINVNRLANGTGQLQMNPNEFIFVFELTSEPDDFYGVDDDEFWQPTAFNQNGDPNFNDMAVHVELNPAGNPDQTKIDGEWRDDVSAPNAVGIGDVEEEDPNSSADTDVEVGNDHIIIG